MSVPMFVDKGQKRRIELRTNVHLTLNIGLGLYYWLLSDGKPWSE